MSPWKGVLDITYLYYWQIKSAPPKLTFAHANNKQKHTWLKVGSITQMAQWLAGARQANEKTCCRWLVTKDDNHTHHCTNIDGKKRAVPMACSFFVITSLQ